MDNDSGIQALLQRAKSGDLQALGELLETYRSYLRILASQQLYRHLNSKCSASDLLLETAYDQPRGSAFLGLSWSADRD